jgi:hypothetical protein
LQRFPHYKGYAMTQKDSQIFYDDIVQDVLRQVLPRVLAPIAKQGLPGTHHFYIAFKTAYPGVRIPAWLKERYPDEMTIVIQHRFWDLKVDEAGFEIGLSFNQRPEKLAIPYAAVVGFVDPSVNFALQFAPPEGFEAEDGPAMHAAPHATPGALSHTPNPGLEEGNNTQDNVVSIDRFRKKP